LARLDEMKLWVSGGRRRQFVKRESAEDFKNLAENRLIGRKISRKLMSRSPRPRACCARAENRIIRARPCRLALCCVIPASGYSPSMWPTSTGGPMSFLRARSPCSPSWRRNRPL